MVTNEEKAVERREVSVIELYLGGTLIDSVME